MNSKYKLIKLFFLLAFILINLASANIQLINGSSFYNQSLNLILESKSIIPQRGTIFDRNGIALASDIEVFDIYYQNSDKNENNLSLDNSINNLKTKDSSLSFENLQLDSNDNKIYILKNITKEKLNSIAEVIKENKDIHTESKFVRHYDYPLETAHIIGYIGLPDVEELNLGYTTEDKVGKYRIESQYENYLKGIKGKYIKFENSEIFQEGQKGNDVYLNIDINWQSKIYSLLENYSNIYNSAGGAGVVMNSQTGEVVSLVSYPGYDINQFISGISEQDYKNIQDSRLQPFLDKAISSAATPGSIFKIVTASSLLENNIIDNDSSYYSNKCIFLGASRFCEFGQNFYGYLNIVQALVKSSNLFFCNYALDLENTQGFNKLVQMANQLGLGSKTDIDLDGEVSGIVDSPEYKLKTIDEAWFPGDTCNMAIGQGANLVTPIQMANIVATIENQGSLLKPRILGKIVNSRSDIILENKKQTRSVIQLDNQTTELIKEGMSGVANDQGSATYVLLNGLPGDVTAKTGSAETYENVDGQMVERTHSWIVGSFTYNNTRYSYTFFLRFGGGGYYISPIVRDFINYINSN